MHVRTDFHSQLCKVQVLHVFMGPAVGELAGLCAVRKR